MSKTRCLTHIVFSTSRRENTISEAHKKKLYAYIMGCVVNKSCHLLRINGMSNHVHMLIDLNPAVALADLMQTVKQWSSHWMKAQPEFRAFKGWSEGYYAFSIAPEDVDPVKEYIINQEKHHAASAFENEIQDMAQRYGLSWHRNDLR